MAYTNLKAQLVSVYHSKNPAKLLYQLLRERSRNMNITHSKMPTWEQHVAFIKSKPYKVWYLIQTTDGKDIGGIYLSKSNEVGLFILKKYQHLGYGTQALWLLMSKYPKECRFFANVNPKNKRSILFFKKAGFKHIQNTYEYRWV